jgi:heat shock protein HslJ
MAQIKPLILLFPLFASAAAPVVAGEAYRARGSETAWTLTIEGGRISYQAPGRPEISVAAPTPTTEDGWTRYRTPRLTVDILPVACDEGMGGERYADSVTVSVDRAYFSGCGGTRLATDDLNGTVWHFAEIAGERAPLTGDLLHDDLYSISFGADSFVGYGGCNRFSAGYVRSGAMLTTRSPFGSTAGRCSDAVSARERRLLQILSQPVRVSLPDPETLLLVGEGGTIRLVRTRMEH